MMHPPFTGCKRSIDNTTTFYQFVNEKAVEIISGIICGHDSIPFANNSLVTFPTDMKFSGNLHVFAYSFGWAPKYGALFLQLFSASVALYLYSHGTLHVRWQRTEGTIVY